MLSDPTSPPYGGAQYVWGFSYPTAPYAGGDGMWSYDGGTTWVPLGFDFEFKTYVEPATPSLKVQCKDGGWMLYNDLFKNQGDCVSSLMPAS
jgi:hypothetical protein